MIGVRGSRLAVLAALGGWAVLLGVARGADVIDERVGGFRLRVNERYESALTFDGEAVITRESVGLALSTTWSTVFPARTATWDVARSDVRGGRQIVLSATQPGCGALRKTVTMTPAAVDYHLEFRVEPGLDGPHQTQWFVVLDGEEGGAYTALTPAARRTGEFHSAAGSPCLVPEVRWAEVPTAAGAMAFDFFDSDTGWNLDDYTQFWARNYLFYFRRDMPPGAGCDRQLAFRVAATAGEEPRPPRFGTVDLRAACTTGLRDDTAGDQAGGWIDDGANDVRNLPVGRQEFRGIPFDVVDPESNGGRACIVLRGRAAKGYGSRQYLPESATVAVGGRRARTLYFLQTCAWPGPDGEVAARYHVRYDDGTAAEVPLRSGYELADWHNPEDAGHAFTAWVAPLPDGSLAGVHLSWWRNPFPDNTIREIEFRTENTTAVPALLAVTLSSGEPRVWGRPADASLDRTDTSAWLPFTFPWCDDTAGTATDVSFLLDPPAGRHGFVAARDGHLRFEDGTPARFWGVNLDRVPCFPHPENAPRIAAHLAKYGCNLVRLHCLDSFQPSRANLFDPAFPDSLHLNPDNLERLDLLLAELRQRGTYVVIDLWGFRSFLPGDDVKEREAWLSARRNSMQGAVFFDERLQELEREYARLLLTHVNPHTGLALKDDPQLALLELFNEVTLFQPWCWSSLSPAYRQQAVAQWNGWLRERYPDRPALARAWGDAQGRRALAEAEDPWRNSVELSANLYNIGAPSDALEDALGEARLNDTIRFLYDTELRHNLMMRSYLRELGVRVPIASSGDIGETAVSARAAAALDLTDQHTYWHHPSYPNGRTRLASLPQLGTSPFARAATDPTTDCPMNTVMRTAAAKTAGLPLINSEWNAPWPNEHRYESPLLLAAYGRLQDWDGLLLYAWTPLRGPGRTPEEEATEPLIERWQSDTDPARAATWQAAAVLFLRGDVGPARRRVAVVHGAQDPFQARRSAVFAHREPYGLRYAPWRVLPFLSRVENVWADGDAGDPADLQLYPCLAPQSPPGRGQHVLSLVPAPAAGKPLPVSGPGERLVEIPADPNAAPDWLWRALHQAGRDWGVWPTLAATGETLTSDTGQLCWDYRQGLLTVDTLLSQAVVGRLGAGAVQLSGLGVESVTRHGAVAVTSLDGKPLAASVHLLLSAGAGAANSEQVLRRTGVALTVLDTGRAPVLAEPVAATVRLVRAAGAPALRAWALDPAGQRAGELAVTRDGDGLRLRIGATPASIYYELAP